MKKQTLKLRKIAFLVLAMMLGISISSFNPVSAKTTDASDFNDSYFTKQEQQTSGTPNTVKFMGFGDETRESARVQVIHNSADAAASVVDVWLDNTLLLDNFAFRTASPFVDAPAGVEFTIAIQGPDSQSPANPIWSKNYTLADGETYILVADGIVSASG